MVGLSRHCVLFQVDQNKYRFFQLQTFCADVTLIGCVAERFLKGLLEYYDIANAIDFIFFD